MSDTGLYPTKTRLALLRAADGDPHGLIASLWPSAGCGQHIASWHPGVAVDSLADSSGTGGGEDRG